MFVSDFTHGAFLMTAAFRVLAASHDQSFVNNLRSKLSSQGFQISSVFSADQIRTVFRKEPPELVVLHHSLGEGEIFNILQEIQEDGWELPVVCIAPSGQVDFETKCLDGGADSTVVEWGNYVEKLPYLFHRAVERKRLQVDYQNAQSKIHSQALLLDYVQDAVVAWDTRGEITYTNYTARSLFEMGGSSCLGKSVKDHYFSLFTPEVKIPTKEGTKEFSQERKFVDSSGTEIWVNSRISYIYDPGEKSRILGFMDICRDITEQKRLREEMQHAQQRTAQSARLAETGRLASGIAHQINNPLTTIIAETQLAQKMLGNEHPVRDSIRAVEEAGWAAQQKVNQLLDFSEAPAQSQRFLSVNESIERSLEKLSEELPGLRKVISQKLAVNIPEVIGNAAQLDKLWFRLIAGKAGDLETGLIQQIQISTRPGKDLGVQVDILDDGPELSEQEVESFFEPDYFSFDEQPGAGLNYSICREITRQHGGSISVQNHQPRGRLLRVYLPGG